MLGILPVGYRVYAKSILIIVLLMGLGGCSIIAPPPPRMPTPTPTATITPTLTSTATITPTGTATPTPSATPTATTTPTATATETVTPSATPTATETATETATSTATPVPTPTATPTPVPAVVILPTATSPAVPVPLGWVDHTAQADVPGAGLSLFAPADWTVLAPSSEDGIADQLEALGAETSAGVMQKVLSGMDALAAGDGGLRMVGLSATPTAADYLPNFTVLVAPSQGATLASLLATARFGVEEAPAATLISGRVVDSLRAGNRDAAVLRYRLDGAALYGVPGLGLRAVQAIFLDDSGDQVAIVTLTAPVQSYAQYESFFMDLVRTITFQ